MRHEAHFFLHVLFGSRFSHVFVQTDLGSQVEQIFLQALRNPSYIFLHPAVHWARQACPLPHWPLQAGMHSSEVRRASLQDATWVAHAMQSLEKLFLQWVVVPLQTSLTPHTFVYLTQVRGYAQSIEADWMQALTSLHLFSYPAQVRWWKHCFGPALRQMLCLTSSQECSRQRFSLVHCCWHVLLTPYCFLNSSCFSSISFDFASAFCRLSLLVVASRAWAA